MSSSGVRREVIIKEEGSKEEDRQGVDVKKEEKKNRFKTVCELIKQFGADDSRTIFTYGKCRIKPIIFIIWQSYTVCLSVCLVKVGVLHKKICQC